MKNGKRKNEKKANALKCRIIFNRFYKYCLLFVSILLSINDVNAQCGYDNTLDSTWTAPAEIGDSVYTDCIFAGKFIRVTNMLAGEAYKVSTCGNNAFDSQITIYPSGGGNSVAYNDDACGVQSELIFVPDATGDYDILIDEYSCGPPNTICMYLLVTRIECPTFDDSYAYFYIDPNPVCPGDVVYFDSWGSGISSYLWDFGDGNTSTNSYTNHTYASAGSYPVILTMTNSCGNDTILYETVQVVNNLPVANANFDIYPNPVCPNDMVHFQAWGDAVSYIWNFGDGSPNSNNQYTDHTYTSAGSYPVTLTMTNSCGNDTILYDTVYVDNNVPIADANFDIYPNPVCPNDMVRFQAWGDANSYVWDFGDGSANSNNQYTDHTYTSAGSYPVILTMTNGCGNDTILYETVQVVNNLPVANTNFYIDPNPVCPNDMVRFQAWGDANSYVWNFGDGSPFSNDSYTNHTYTSLGSYPVSLTLTNGCGNYTILYDTVYVEDNVFSDPDDYDYDVINDEACPGDTLIFYVWPSGGGSYLWEFGDGNSTTETTQYYEDEDEAYDIARHAYSAPGDYTVNFTLTNRCGNSFTESFGVYIGDDILVDGEFWWNEYYPATCENIAFYVYGGSSYEWDFGDGSEIITTTASLSRVTHAYSSAGTYDISVTITNSCGNSDIETDYITITGICPLLTATASGTGPTCKSLADGSATVTVSNGLSPYTYLWDDPAGQTTATATGLSEGTYTVIVTDAAGDNASATITLTASYELLISIDQIIDATCGDNDGVATASATGGISPYIYQWSNGVIGAVDTALTAGYYIVTATDANGCNNFAQATVSDHNGPVITVVSTTDADCDGSGGAIDIFISQGTTPYTFLWSNGSVTEDVSGLTAGPYEVSVSDANGCVGLKSIIVEGQETFTLTTSTTNANCGSSNGSATVNISGGASPFTYLWSSGGTIATESNIAAGVYTVTVTDANGCVGSITAAVSNINSPSIAVDSITDAVCGGAGGSIFISVTGGTPAYTYLWSNSSVNQDLINALVGVYDIEVTDANGCIATESFEISMVPTPENQICLVTVDSVTQSNLVVWEKPAQQGGIESYNIYKESSQAGVYFLIGNQIYSDLSEFNDDLSDPKVRSWKYKLSVVDACGNESDLSQPHKTMHLTQNLGLNNTVNLIWDHYEGFTFSTYNIYRYSSSLGWEKLGEIPNNLTSYTDLSPPSSGFYYYVVEVVRPTSCTSTRKAGTHRSSRSNRTVDLTTGVKAIPGNMTNLGIYPNPTNGVFTLTFDMKKKEDVTVRMFDINGRLVHSIQYKNYFGTFRKTLDFSDLGSGLYFFQIVSETGIVYTQIVIE